MHFIGIRSFQENTIDRLFKMTALTDNHKNLRPQTYYPNDSAVFRKTKERYGALSNMAGGFPLHVNGVNIRTSEALYQACRFPDLPKIQNEIIAQHSPMTAKMQGKPHRQNSRSDWNNVRVKIMRWCLRVKLVQNWEKFRYELLDTEDLPIVEYSRRDDFWGAKMTHDATLKGVNALGRLLMELRDSIRHQRSDEFKFVEPLRIPNFRLRGEQIEVVRKVSYVNKHLFSHINEARPLDLGTKTPSVMFTAVPCGYSTVLPDHMHININTASVSVMESVLGITKKRAEKIVAHRENYGPFLTKGSIQSVRGIGKKKYQRISDKITVGLDTPDTQLPLPMGSK